MSGLVERFAPARLGPSFRWLVSSFWVSNLGDGIAVAAGPLLVASRTSDPFLVALAVVLQRLPWLCFGLLAGVVADRHDRRAVLVAVQVVRAALTAAVVATIALDIATSPVVLGALFLLGTAEVFADTTASTMLPMLVAGDDLAIGNARVMGGVVTLNHLAGPPVGAALFAASPAAAFGAVAACMAASAVLATGVRLPTAAAEPRPAPARLRREVAEGLRWLWGHAAVRTLAITIVAFNVTWGAAWSVLVLYADERLGAGEVGFGLLTTASALGGVLATVGYGWLTARCSLATLMQAGLVIETLTHLGLALTTRLPVALGILFAFGAHAFVWATTATSVRQRAVPHELQGRVASVYLIGVQGGVVVGSLLGGAIAGVGGITAPFWFAFAGSAALVVALWPQFRHIAHADDEAAAVAPPPPAPA